MGWFHVSFGEFELRRISVRKPMSATLLFLSSASYFLGLGFFDRALFFLGFFGKDLQAREA